MYKMRPTIVALIAVLTAYMFDSSARARSPGAKEISTSDGLGTDNGSTPEDRSQRLSDVVLDPGSRPCELNRVDPQQYLTDVLIRIQTHPQSRIDELLPHNWKPPSRSPPLPN
jgi:hypothetical protein